MHVHHTDPERLVGLLSLDDADRLLTSTAIRTPSVRVAQDGSVLSPAAYTRGATLAGEPLSGLVDPRKALELFGKGATVVFQGLHRYWEPLAELVAELELELGHPCQANAYLTPPGSQGFAVHKDTHDVFVFQTHGHKQWEVHVADGAVEEVMLEPGVCMYLPTGTPHAARAQDAVSLHVTLGINQLTWRTLLEQAVRPLLGEGNDDHLPAGYLTDSSELTMELADRLSALVEALQTTDADAVVSRQVERFLTTRNSRLRGGLLDALAVEHIVDKTRLRRREGKPVVLRDRGDRLSVLIGDRSLDMPAWLRRSMEVVRDVREFCPCDLGIDEQSRLVLSRRLVREGLLEVLG